MSSPKIIIVLEFTETGGGEIWPVEGRSGTIYGYATRCSKRGTFCLRMPLEQFRKCRDDIFNGRKKFFFPVPDVEIEEVADVAHVENVQTPFVEIAPEADIPGGEVLEEISNQEAAALDEAPSAPVQPVVESPKAPAKRKPAAKRSVKPSRKRS